MVDSGKGGRVVNISSVGGMTGVTGTCGASHYGHGFIL